jgi:intracellular septation protein A
MVKVTVLVLIVMQTTAGVKIKIKPLIKSLVNMALSLDAYIWGKKGLAFQR